MKNRGIYIIIAFISITVPSLLFLFYSKHYIRYSACYKIKTLKTPFYPDAYCFINSKDKFDLCVTPHDNAFDETKFIEYYKIDFNRYTYVIVYGAPIKNMYYSLKTTLWDDDSPSYDRAIRYNKKFVVINYEHPTGYIYLYRIKKDLSLRGFGGP